MTAGEEGERWLRMATLPELPSPEQQEVELLPATMGLAGKPGQSEGSQSKTGQQDEP